MMFTMMESHLGKNSTSNIQLGLNDWILTLGMELINFNFEVWSLLLLEKWLGVNEKLSLKSGPSRSIWVEPSPSNLCIFSTLFFLQSVMSFLKNCDCLSHTCSNRCDSIFIGCPFIHLNQPFKKVDFWSCFELVISYDFESLICIKREKKRH